MIPAGSPIWWYDMANLPTVEPYPGVTRRTLINQDGYRILAGRIDAEAKFLDLDVHEPGPEEVFVLGGVFNDRIRGRAASPFIHNARDFLRNWQSSRVYALLESCPHG